MTENRYELNGDAAPTLRAHFEHQVEETPDATALVDGDGPLSYRQLNQRANRLAHALAARGVGPATRVGVCLPRSIDLVVAILAIIKTGAAAVPMDVALPAARRRAILDDAQPVVLLANDSDAASPSIAGELVVLSTASAEIERQPESNPDRHENADDILSVLYTSGVTGAPKGVIVPGAAVLHHMQWMWRTYPFGPADVGLVHRSYMLISASWDYLGPLLQGVPSLVVSEREAGDLAWLLTSLAARRVTHVSASPAFWDGLLDQVERHPTVWRTLRLATISGEQVTVRIVRRWQRAFPEARLLNVYGSTECVRPTVYDTSALPADAERVPIGTPLPNVDVRLLDDRLEPIAAGELGELCVAGPCVTAGYTNLPLTAERFVRHPAVDGVLYRTGDIGRVRVDGTFEVIGRRDQQIKIRGFRVELGDIEAALVRCAGVRHAAVVAVEDPRGGSRVAAYVVADVDPPPTAAALRRRLAEKLPDYMIPSVFVPLRELPLTRSGKTDWAALPPPSLEVGDASADPLTSTEQALAGIWTDVFALTSIGRDDDFFDLGGHSLMAMQIAARVVDAFGVDLPGDVLFSTPTIRAAAAAIDRARTAAAT